MKKYLPFVLVSVLAIAAMVGHARAADPACQNLRKVQENVTAWYPGAKSLHLTGAQAKLFIERYNALPPVTQYPIDEVLVLTDPKRTGSLVIGLKGGCFFGQDKIDNKALARILAEIGTDL